MSFAPTGGPSFIRKRIDDMIAALKSKGVPVLWVGMPAVRGTKSTSDMSYLDELYRARAEKAGITYVDIWDGFVDEQGHYAQQGPDFEGQTRRLRTYDGVHFTKYGAEKLAHYVDHDLRRMLTNRVMPVALPGPEEQSPAKGARPAVGPVVPLGAIGGGEGGELLAARIRPAQKPTRSQRACSVAAMRYLRRPGAPTTSPGRAPAPKPAATGIWHQRSLRLRPIPLPLRQRAPPERTIQIRMMRPRAIRPRAIRKNLPRPSPCLLRRPRRKRPHP